MHPSEEKPHILLPGLLIIKFVVENFRKSLLSLSSSKANFNLDVEIQKVLKSKAKCVHFSFKLIAKE